MKKLKFEVSATITKTVEVDVTEHPDYDANLRKAELIEMASELAHEKFNPNMDGTEEDYAETSTYIKE